MITLAELKFEAADCCAFHQTITVRRADGVDVGLQRSKDGLTFSASLYNSKGLLTRHLNLSAQDAEAVLNP